MKNNKYVQVLFGIVVPLCVLGHVIYNLVTWTVFLSDPSRSQYGWLQGGRRSVAITDSFSVVGIVVIKLSLVIALVSWFWFANQDKTEHWGPTGLIVSGVVAAIGLVVVVVGMFVGW